MSERKTDLWRLASLGPHMVGCVLVGFLAGYFWLDPWLDTEPTFTVVCILLGVGAGFIELFKELRYLERHEAEQQAEELGDDGSG